MKLRPLLITVSTLGVAALAAHFLTQNPPPPEADTRVGNPLVSPEILEKAARIHLKDTGKTVDLVRQADGTWTVSSYYGLPADFSKISSLTGSLSNAKLDRFVRGNPERLARLEFKDARIVLGDETDKELWSVTLGKNNENGGRFLKLGSETNAFVSGLNLWLDAESRNWAETSLLKVKPEEVVELTVPFKDGGSITLTRAKPEEDFTSAALPAGRLLKKTKVTSLLSSLGNLRFSETVAKDDPKAVAAASHSRTAALKTVSGKTYRLVISQAPAPSPTPTPTVAPGTTPPPPMPPAPNPVFVAIESSDKADPLQQSMEKRAFEVYEFLMNSLPGKLEDLLEPAPVAPPTAPPTGLLPAASTVPTPPPLLAK